jgi:exonuclease SbcC
MIPQLLILKNFLSYREATLDFRDLHVACICGANGAGKSSLLEAIAWALWGQSRAVAEDDVIRLGETEARVDFTFEYRQQTYRVIRTRYRGQSSALEFQVKTVNGFRSLTGKGMRMTQQLILQHLKLDYETFINSAYLRQGRADEFMLKRPSERKQILADLLKLNQYDQLSEQAKERSRQLKAELNLLERNIGNIYTQLQQLEPILAEQHWLAALLADLQRQQEQDGEALRHLQAVQQQRQTWQQQLTFQRQQQQHLVHDCHRLQQELQAAQQQQQSLESMLRDGEAIANGYAQFQRLQLEEEQQSAKFQAYQAAQTQRQQLQQQQAEAINVLKDQMRQVLAQLEALQQQEQDVQQTLSKAGNVEVALEQLQQARARLTELDNLHIQITPLLQRKQQVQAQLDRTQDQLSARLDNLQAQAQELQVQQQRQPKLQQAVLEVAEQVKYLENRRLYQHKVRERGIERRTFMERLKERQRDCELQLAELDHKIQMLQRGAQEEKITDKSERIEEQSLLRSSFPPCPLCDRPLDEHHWTVVVERHRAEQKEVQDQIWVIREQLTVSDREIEVLRKEYREVEKELSQYGAVLERRGQLQEQLQGTAEVQNRLQHLLQEQEDIERSLRTATYTPDLQEELQLLNQSLNELQYDDKDHALARGDVDCWRWAEIKQAEIKQAQRRSTQIAERKPQLEEELTALEQQLGMLHSSPLQQQLDELDRHIVEINYSLEQHTALRQVLRQAQTWQLRYQELTQAQQLYPQIQQRIKEVTELLEERLQVSQTLQHQIETLIHELQQTLDCSDAIQSFEYQIQQRRAKLDEQIAYLGRLQQQQQQLELLQQQQEKQEQQIQTLQRQCRVYQELAQAFSKNGIQALMIENVLPQLEAEANQILGRLSANQLHLQFVTQRIGRRKGTINRASAKLIDTLDILISDLQGTRPYETYSGGEAFRVNFAIRLALARLLAQQAGTALQMLIVDEGFGTQDEAGCDRLIGAINAIASDFACILTVTHMPHFKEAFQTRIEVHKTENGSQISLSV